LAREREKFGNLRLTRIAAALERYTWRSASRILPVTRVLADILVEGGVASERIEVVPNGIVLDRFPPRGERPDEGPVTLGFVGFIRTWHGLNMVVAEMPGHPLRLTVVGDGPARPELEQQAARLGIADKVTFTGIVPHEDVPARVGTFDIALQPQVTAYASPLKIFDYMAASCAIVAPDQPNIREILRHEENALLFDPTDPAAMWAAIRRLMLDTALRERLGQAARADLEARRYTWLGNAERIAGWANDLIAVRRSASPSRSPRSSG
jgi:glycosyltransferase involved in cell wall biosynthesis